MNLTARQLGFALLAAVILGIAAAQWRLLEPGAQNGSLTTRIYHGPAETSHSEAGDNPTTLPPQPLDDSLTKSDQAAAQPTGLEMSETVSGQSYWHAASPDVAAKPAALEEPRQWKQFPPQASPTQAVSEIKIKDLPTADRISASKSSNISQVGFTTTPQQPELERPQSNANSSGMVSTQKTITENGETRLTLPPRTTGPTQSAQPANAPDVMASEVRAPDELVLPPTPAPTQANRTGPVNGMQVSPNRETITLRLNGEDLRTVLEMISLESKLNILASDNVKGTVTANFQDVSVNDALEAILASSGFQMQQRNGIVFVGTPADFSRMEEVSLAPETRIIRPCFVSAKELEALVRPLLTANGTVHVTSAANHGLSESGGSSGSSNPMMGGATGSGGASGSQDSHYTGQDILMVRDVPTAIFRIEELVHQIDLPPLQVAIEALILSVKLDDRHRLGVNLELLKGDGVRVISGNMPGTLETLETGQGLLSFGFLEANVGSFIAALDDIGETNVIAAPHVLALNKMSAEILIGEQIGFANTTVTQTAAVQSIQFLDVGTQLRLRPHVNEEGLIRLEIHPEVSQGTVRSVGDLALPEKTVTQVTTNVMCRDNETIIIGGLIREEMDDTHHGVPLLGKLPVMGPLFRSRNRNTSREELLVLLTPHVVRDPSDALPSPDVVNNFVNRRASMLVSEKKNWFLRKQEAQRYVYLARHAWAAGNRTACQHYCQIALDLDADCIESLSFAPEVINTLDTSGNYSNTIQTDPNAYPSATTLEFEGGFPSMEAPSSLEAPVTLAPPTDRSWARPEQRFSSLGSRPAATTTTQSADTSKSQQRNSTVGVPFGAPR